MSSPASATGAGNGRIRAAEARDLRAVAAIHKTQFADHFLAQYSRRLLERYYEPFLGKSVFLVHDAAAGIDGFVLGGKPEQVGVCRADFLRGNLPRCLVETLVHPRLWWEAFRRGISNLLASRSHPDQPTEPAAPPSADLLSIAVSPAAIGTGIGAMLIDAFEQAIRDTSCADYGLCVLKTNGRAVRFYEKMGFQIVADCGVAVELRKRLPVKSTVAQ